MKKQQVFATGLVQVVAFATLMATATLAYAQHNATLTVVAGKEKTAMIAVDNLKGEPATLHIINAQGDVLHKQVITADGSYINSLDLSGLGDGSYTMSLQTSRGRTIEHFDIEQGTLMVNDLLSRPFIGLSNDRLNVVFKNSRRDNVFVRLYNEEGSLIHEEKGISDEVFAKTFNVGRLSNGKYAVEITSGTTRYREQFQVK